MSGLTSDSLAFFPWLQLRNRVRVVEYILEPYSRGEAPYGRNSTDQSAADAILGSYRSSDDSPVQSATLLLPQNEIAAEKIFVFSELVALAGLANRNFFQAAGYMNRDYFQFFVQKLAAKSGHIAIETRRRDGSTTNLLPLEDFRVLRPPHVFPTPVSLDENLLASLIASESTLDDRDWTNLFEGVLNFNLANTDSGAIPAETEIVFAVSSFERLLGIGSGKEKALITKFTELFEPEEPVGVADCPRLQNRKCNYDTVRGEWLADLFRVRGAAAHGRRKIQYPRRWQIPEHLLLASFAFPLLLKIWLAKRGTYALTDFDREQIESLEPLLCLESYSSDSEDQAPWLRVLGEVTIHRIAVQAYESFVREGKGSNETVQDSKDTQSDTNA